MGDGGYLAKCETCEEELLLHACDIPKLFDCGVTKNVGIRRPAGEGDLWLSQGSNCRFN